MSNKNIMEAFMRINDLLGSYVPEVERTDQVEKDWRIVNDTLKSCVARSGEVVATSDPLPCPFCGSTDVGGAMGKVSCCRCNAEIEVQNTNTPYAVELWNRRAHHSASVPDGWKLVPITPSDEMCTAAMQAEIKSNAECGEPAPFSDIWDSMISAAPDTPDDD